MISFKNLALALALTLPFGGCGDDSNNTPGSDAADAGDPDDNGAEGRKCKASYEPYTEEQITANVKDPMGACAGPADIAGICAKSAEKDPVELAKTDGQVCFFAFNGDMTLSEDEKKTKIAACTLDGLKSDEAEVVGLKAALPTMSEKCLTCYVNTILCAVQNCAGECGSDPGGQPCSDCRTAFKCTIDFYKCNGLPSTDELAKAVK